jgi:ACR3 family arsenite efflux pump ArsB
MKSIQKKKNFIDKNVFFWIEIKRKVGFFVTFFSLQEKKMTRTSQITHTNPITNLCLSLSLLQPLLSTFPTKQRFPTVFSRAKVVKIRSNFRIKPLVFVFLRLSLFKL